MLLQVEAEQERIPAVPQEPPGLAHPVIDSVLNPNTIGQVSTDCTRGGGVQPMLTNPGPARGCCLSGFYFAIQGSPTIA